MKYVGLVLAIIAFVGGFFGLTAWTVIACALASAFVHMRPRQKQAREQHVTGPLNSTIDGIYLIAIQTLIMFAAFISGFLIKYMSSIL